MKENRNQSNEHKLKCYRSISRRIYIIDVYTHEKVVRRTNEVILAISHSIF